MYILPSSLLTAPYLLIKTKLIKSNHIHIKENNSVIIFYEFTVLEWKDVPITIDKHPSQVSWFPHFFLSLYSIFIPYPKATNQSQTWLQQPVPQRLLSVTQENTSSFLPGASFQEHFLYFLSYCPSFFLSFLAGAVTTSWFQNLSFLCSSEVLPFQPCQHITITNM